MAFTELPPDAQLDQAPQAAAGFTELPADAKLDAPQNAQTGLDRVGQGLRDPIDAGAQLAVHSLPNGVVNAVNNATSWVNRQPVIGPVTKALGMVPATQEQLDSSIASREQQYQADRAAAGDKGIDWYRMAGNVATTLPLAAAGGAPATVGQAVRMGALSGGAMGLLSPVTDQSTPFWQEKATQAATGAVTGAATAPLTYGLSRLLQPEVTPQVRTLMDRGVTPTPGQILGGRAAVLEDKASDFIPLVSGARRRAVEQLNRATYNEVLEPIGKTSTAPLGREAVAEVKQQLQTAYNDVLPKLTFQADQQFGSELANLGGMAANLPPQQAKQFANIVRNQVVEKLGPQGTMDGLTFKGVESELGNLAKGYRSDSSFENRQLGAAVSELQKSMRGALERANPDDAPVLKAINEGYARYARLRNAASSVAAEDGVFSPSQLLSAVKSQDVSRGKDAFATGGAKMQELADAARSVLGPKYPNSGTAGRAFTGGVLGSVAMGGAGSVNPVAAGGLLAAALPYTSMGQRAAAHLLAGDRGAARVLTGPLADAIRASTVPSVAVARGLLASQ